MVLSSVYLVCSLESHVTLSPDMTELSKDQWKVFYINKNGLSSQEKCLWNSKSLRKKSL